MPFGAGRFGGTRTYDPATGNEVAAAGNSNTWALAVAGGELATATYSYSSSVPTLWGISVDWRCDANVTGQGSGLGMMLDIAFVGDSLMWGGGPNAVGYVGCPTGATTWASTWNTDLGGSPVAIVGVGPTHVAYLDDTGTLTVLDAATGAVAWTAEVGAAAPPAVADGKIIVRTGDGRVLDRRRRPADRHHHGRPGRRLRSSEQLTDTELRQVRLGRVLSPSRALGELGDDVRRHLA